MGRRTGHRIFEVDGIMIAEVPQTITGDESGDTPGQPLAPGLGGSGVPNGGTTGQVLKKLSNSNGDADWREDDGLPAGAAAPYVQQERPTDAQVPAVWHKLDADGYPSGEVEFFVTDPYAPDAPPANLSSPGIVGTPQTGFTLTATVGTWSNYPTVFSYVWKRNGAAISGATAQTYMLTSDDEGKAITVTVTASNGIAAASATSAPVNATALQTLATIFPSTVVLRYDAATIMSTLGGELAQIDDLSGAGRHAAQATSGKRPSLEMDADGYKFVRFNATNIDRLTAALGITLAQPWTVLAILRYENPPSTNGQGRKVFWSGAGNTPAGFYQFDNTENLSMEIGSNLIGSGLNYAATRHVAQWDIAGASSKIFLDGTQVTSGDAGAGTIATLNLGATGGDLYPSDLCLYELALLSATPLSPQRVDTQALAVNKWGVAS